MTSIARDFLKRPGPKRDLLSMVSETATWGEMLYSDIAERDADVKRSQDNPPDSVLENLEFTANEIVDPVRREFGRVVVVAGYRSPQLQAMVKAPRESAITKGYGVELRVAATTDIHYKVMEQIAAGMGDKHYSVSPSWYLAMWLSERMPSMPIESISVDGGDKGYPAWVTISAHRNPERHRRIIYASGPWTSGATVKLHQVDLRNLGVR